jgi:hypothetical protein
MYEFVACFMQYTAEYLLQGKSTEGIQINGCFISKYAVHKKVSIISNARRKET